MEQHFSFITEGHLKVSPVNEVCHFDKNPQVWCLQQPEQIGDLNQSEADPGSEFYASRQLSSNIMAA